MYRSIDCSYTQCGPDRSRFSYSVSASVFEPTSEDIRLEKAIEDFAAMSMGIGFGRGGRPAIGSRASTFSSGEQRAYPSSNYGRVQDAPYPGSYAGSIAGSTTSRLPHEPKRIGYSRSITAPSVMGSSCSTSYRSRQSRQTQDDYPNYAEPGTLVRYSKPRDEVWDDAMSVGPEDSVSQVSSRTARRSDYVPRSERRGRTRRREDERSMFSRVTAVPVEGYGRGGGRGGELYDVDEQGEPEYYTRDITPWQ